MRPWTYRGYEVHVRLHIVPALGNVRLTRLKPHEVQQWTNERLAAGFAPKTVDYMKETLQTALNQAMKWGLVMRNVAALVDPPRGTSTHTVKPLTVDEAKILLRAIRGDRMEALYPIALTTGLRQAEILG